MPLETEKLSLTMIDGKPTDGTSTSKKDQDGHGMMNVDFFSTFFFKRVSYTCSSDYSMYDGFVHTLTRCTHNFLHIARAQSHLHIFMRVAFSLLMSHPSLLYLHTHFDITFLSIFLPNIPVLKAQDMRNSARASRSLATWPSQMQTRVKSPHKFDYITSLDSDTMLIDDPDLNEISEFSKNTRENTGLLGVLTMFETSVSHVSHDDFVLQIEDKEIMHRETDCQRERERPAKCLRESN